MICKIGTVAVLNGFTDRSQIPGCIITGNNCLPNGVNKSGIPLRIESCTASSNIFRNPRIIPHAFADADLAGKQLLDFRIDPLH